MKKLIVLSLLLATFSCKKENKEDKITAEETSSIRIESVVASKNFEERVQMYNLLSPKEKFTMWNDHLKKAIDQFTLAGNKNKAILIDELLSNLTQSLFYNTSSKIADVFDNYLMPMWSEKAKSLFSGEEIYSLTFDPNSTI